MLEVELTPAAELLQAQHRIGEFEHKYGMPFSRLQKVGLPKDAGLEAHEDYVEWSSLEGYTAELTEKLAAMQSI